MIKRNIHRDAWPPPLSPHCNLSLRSLSTNLSIAAATTRQRCENGEQIMNLVTIFPFCRPTGPCVGLPNAVAMRLRTHSSRL